MSTKTPFNNAYISTLVNPKHRQMAEAVLEYFKDFVHTSQGLCGLSTNLEDKLQEDLNLDDINLVVVIMVIEDELDDDIDEEQHCPGKDYPVTDKQATVADLLNLAISLVKA